MPIPTLDGREPSVQKQSAAVCENVKGNHSSNKETDNKYRLQKNTTDNEQIPDLAGISLVVTYAARTYYIGIE